MTDAKADADPDVKVAAAVGTAVEDDAAECDGTDTAAADDTAADDTPTADDPGKTGSGNSLIFTIGSGTLPVHSGTNVIGILATSPSTSTSVRRDAPPTSHVSGMTSKSYMNCFLIAGERRGRDSPESLRPLSTPPSFPSSSSPLGLSGSHWLVYDIVSVAEMGDPTAANGHSDGHPDSTAAAAGRLCTEASFCTNSSPAPPSSDDARFVSPRPETCGRISVDLSRLRSTVNTKFIIGTVTAISMRLSGENMRAIVEPDACDDPSERTDVGNDRADDSDITSALANSTSAAASTSA